MAADFCKRLFSGCLPGWLIPGTRTSDTGYTHLVEKLCLIFVHQAAEKAQEQGFYF